ncbi:uncharacterized protein [Dermacentor andersoni]|uniref:uncharacterized protein isoform X1 n=2 Tax=Dermacentor TaxID=34619 RepID=UPI003B3A550B
MAKNMRNLRAAREYVDVVMQRLRDDVRLQEMEPSELRSTGDGSDWKLHDGTVRGLGRVSHDGRPWLVEVLPHNEGDADAPTPEERFDVAATVLVRDCEFEALYDYTGVAQQVSGKVTGKVEIVRVYMLIGHPKGPDDVPELKVFDTKEFMGLTLAKVSVGILHQKFITEATAQAVRSCIEQAMTSRVAPLLATVLKGIAFPDFTKVQH